MICPHCSYDQMPRPYTQPWDLVKCDKCGHTNSASAWLDDNLNELGDPFEDYASPDLQPLTKESTDADTIHLVPQTNLKPEHCAFISHNKADASFARDIGQYLRHRGIEVWLDEWEIFGGDSIVDKLEEGIRSSNFFILIVSPASMKSNWVRQEVRAALSRRIEENSMKIIPLILEEVDEMPAFLADWKHISFVRKERWPSPYDELLKAITRPDVKPKLGTIRSTT